MKRCLVFFAAVAILGHRLRSMRDAPRARRPCRYDQRHRQTAPCSLTHFAGTPLPLLSFTSTLCSARFTCRLSEEAVKRQTTRNSGPPPSPRSSFLRLRSDEIHKPPTLDLSRSRN